MAIYSRIISLFAVVGLAFVSGCSKPQPLTNEKVKELLEASSFFKPQVVFVTLTGDEIQRGKSYGYWTDSREGDHPTGVQRGGTLLLTPVGNPYFSGNPLIKNPIMTLRQQLGARLVEIEDLQPLPEDPEERVATYTWIWKFENQVPEMVEFFKDQPPQESTKTFRHGNAGWEIVVQ